MIFWVILDLFGPSSISNAVRGLLNNWLDSITWSIDHKQRKNFVVMIVRITLHHWFIFDKVRRIHYGTQLMPSDGFMSKHW